MAQVYKQCVEFLIDEFREAIQKQNSRSAPAERIDLEKMMASLEPFRKFCEDYFRMHQVEQLHTNLAGNYGIQLTNKKVFLAGAPVDQLQGTMQPSTYVPVTGAETAREMRGSSRGDLVPPGAVDFTQPTGPMDMTASQPAIRFDQDDPRAHPARR